MLRRLPVIGVFGRGTKITPEEAALARAVGAMVAKLGAHLLTGGGYGVMEAAAQGFTQIENRAGFSIGIVPRDPNGPLQRAHRDPDGRPYPNAFIEIPIFTALPPRVEDWHSIAARNHVNVLSADAAVVLPGDTGTRNELDMTAFYREDAGEPRGERRTVLIGPLAAFASEHQAFFPHAATVEAARAHLARVLAARGFTLAEVSREPVAG
jgi:predicted Rossmann-fold nucleotide-binding protein